MKFQAIKGVRDILPPESTLWNRVEQTAREVFGTFGFTEIRLPIFEQTELFARSVGGDTDIVGKEMYSFEDKPTGLPDPGDTAPVTYLANIKHLMNVGTIPPNPKVLASIEFQVANYVGRAATQEARFIWQSYVRDIQLGESISLRPEATASVVRAYIEHGMQVLPGNVKLYYIGPMFRREKPQKGRYRQFYQIGAEVLGASDAPGIDAQLIEMLIGLFDRLKLTGAILNINSIGCKECRPAYVELLRAELQKVREQLGEDSKRRIETNPLRVLDSKLPQEQSIIETLPRIAEHLCESCRTHYDEVKRQLNLRGITYQENWRLVRGLDYYMRTTFEITAPGLGSQNAVCGGGRYDGLVELLGGPATTKGIGFAIGTDRLMLSLKEAGQAEAQGGFDVYLAWFGSQAQTAGIALARRLRDAGFAVELPAVELKFGKSLGLADRLKARHAVIIGDDELAAGVVAVKRLSDGTQQKLAEPGLFSYLNTERNK